MANLGSTTVYGDLDVTLDLDVSGTIYQDGTPTATEDWVNSVNPDIPNGALTNDDVTFTAGTDLTGGGTVSLGGSATIDHANTSSQGNVSAGAGAAITDINLDGNGHTTSISTTDFDSRFVLESGDTMGGDLTVNGDIISDGTGGPATLAATTSGNDVGESSLYIGESGVSESPLYGFEFAYDSTSNNSSIWGIGGDYSARTEVIKFGRSSGDVTIPNGQINTGTQGGKFSPGSDSSTWFGPRKSLSDDSWYSNGAMIRGRNHIYAVVDANNSGNSWNEFAVKNGNNDYLLEVKQSGSVSIDSGSLTVSDADGSSFVSAGGGDTINGSLNFDFSNGSAFINDSVNIQGTGDSGPTNATGIQFDWDTDFGFMGLVDNGDDAKDMAFAIEQNGDSFEYYSAGVRIANLSANGLSIESGNISVDNASGSDFVAEGGDTMSGSLDMDNNSISGVNSFAFSDPGSDGSINWSNWQVYEAPNDLTNNTGNLQFVTGSTRAATITQDQSLILPNGRLYLRDNNGIYFGNEDDFSFEYESSSNELVLTDNNGVELIRQPKAGPTQFLQGIDAGSIEAPADSYTQLANTSVTSSLTSGDRVGYTLAIDNQSAIAIDGEADGSGGIQNTNVRIPNHDLRLNGNYIQSVSHINGSNGNHQIDFTSSDVHLTIRDQNGNRGELAVEDLYITENGRWVDDHMNDSDAHHTKYSDSDARDAIQSGRVNQVQFNNIEDPSNNRAIGIDDSEGPMYTDSGGTTYPLWNSKYVSGGNAISVSGGVGASSASSISISVNDGGINHDSTNGGTDSDAHHSRYSDGEARSAVDGSSLNNLTLTDSLEIPVANEGDTATEGEIAISPDGVLLIGK